MKILIITYNREVNPGTFLQAYGVQYAMKQLFPKAQIDLLKHRRLYTLMGSKNKTTPRKKKNWTFIKSKLMAIPRRLKYEWGYKHNFHLTDEEFDFFDYDHSIFKQFVEGYDLIVVGSDTILINLEKNGKQGLMWLKDIHKPKILFAASAAPAKYANKLTAEQCTLLKEQMQQFMLLGVRDNLTLNFMSYRLGLGNLVYQQNDPTYLIPSNKFSLPWLTKRKLDRIHHSMKIVLVNFGAGFEKKAELTRALKQRGYYTISTLYNPDADANLMTFSPFEWAAMFTMVDFTITERFHDSVFTLRNGKPVIAIDWDKSRIIDDGFSKTSDLLERYGLNAYHFNFTQPHAKVSEVIYAIDNLDFQTIKIKIQTTNAIIKTRYEHLMKEIVDKMKTNELICLNISGGGKLIKDCINIFRKPILDAYFFRKRKPFLKKIERIISHDTSIISSNCFAGRIMQDLRMQYNTPTLGLYFMYPDYIEFLQHLEFYLKKAKIEFVEHSKYPIGDERRAKWKHWYPIGLLNGKVEIHFLHYHTEQEAAEKWYRRASRVDFNNLFVIGMDQNLCTKSDIEAFAKLPFKRKVFFSSHEVEGEGIIYIKEFAGQGQVGDPYKKGHVFYRYLCEQTQK